MTGLVYLIGAGPGDSKLITVKGKECIECADVIVYDYLADAHLLEWARPDAELIYAGKQCKDHTMHQWEINELLVKKGKEGKIVARLKGGDPLVAVVKRQWPFVRPVFLLNLYLVLHRLSQRLPMLVFL